MEPFFDCFSRFLSTLSLRRATIRFQILQSGITNFYPRSPCGERQGLSVSAPFHSHFYPRSPCGERPLMLCPAFPIRKFLSTLSLRRATLENPFRENSRSNFYPRSPCGERLDGWCFLGFVHDISIHALLAESDQQMWGNGDSFIAFLSTLSLRRATNGLYIVALHWMYFYPRSPCGERHKGHHSRCGSFDFYPRSPCGERRFSNCSAFSFISISIHALLAESDKRNGHYWYDS